MDEVIEWWTLLTISEDRLSVNTLCSQALHTFHSGKSAFTYRPFPFLIPLRMTMDSPLDPQAGITKKYCQYARVQSVFLDLFYKGLEETMLLPDHLSFPPFNSRTSLKLRSIVQTL